MSDKRIESMSTEELQQRLKVVEMENAWLQIKVAQQTLFVRQIGKRNGELSTIQSKTRRLKAMLKWAVSLIDVAIDERDAWITPREYEMLAMARKLIKDEQQ